MDCKVTTCFYSPCFKLRASLFVLGSSGKSDEDVLNVLPQFYNQAVMLTFFLMKTHLIGS